MRERICWDKRETAAVNEIIFMFLGFTFGVDSISEEVAGFSPLWFPEENYLCLLSLVLFLCFIDVHVILSVKYPKIIMLA